MSLARCAARSLLNRGRRLGSSTNRRRRTAPPPGRLSAHDLGKARSAPASPDPASSLHPPRRRARHDLPSWRDARIVRWPCFSPISGAAIFRFQPLRDSRPGHAVVSAPPRSRRPTGRRPDAIGVQRPASREDWPSPGTLLDCRLPARCAATPVRRPEVAILPAGAVSVSINCAAASIDANSTAGPPRCDGRRRREMSMKLSVRLLLLVLIAALPILAMQVHGLLQDREQRKAAIAEQALELARLAAAQQDQFIEGARYLLAAAAQLPDVQNRDAAACNARMAEFLRLFPTIAGIGAVAPDGVQFCSGPGGFTGISIADRRVFPARAARQVAGDQRLHHRSPERPAAAQLRLSRARRRGRGQRGRGPRLRLGRCRRPVGDAAAGRRHDQPGRRRRRPARPRAAGARLDRPAGARGRLHAHAC